MNPHDEELQRKFEQGEIPDGEGLEVKAYQQVFRALRKDPGYALPANFAECVAGKAIADRKESVSKDYLWFAAGMFFLAVASLATVLFIGFRFDFGFLNMMADYKGLVFFGIAFVIFLHWLDKKLVHKNHVDRGIDV